MSHDSGPVAHKYWILLKLGVANMKLIGEPSWQPLFVGGKLVW